MATEYKPLSLFVRQKTPEAASGGSLPAPTSADVKKKLLEVLDNLTTLTL